MSFYYESALFLFATVNKCSKFLNNIIIFIVYCKYTMNIIIEQKNWGNEIIMRMLKKYASVNTFILSDTTFSTRFDIPMPDTAYTMQN